MDLNFNQIASDMIDAMKAVVGDNIQDIRDLADDELEDFAKRSITLSKKVAEGIITPEQAKLILKIRKNALETVLLSIAGISILAAQEAINAAIGVLRGVINKAIPGVDIL